MTIRNPRRRRLARDLFRSLAVMSAFMLALSVWTTVSATRSPAGAATSSGSVSITPTSGSSGTAFGLTFGSTPQCAGDSASGGYNWSAIMIPASADIGAVTMSATGPNQVSGQYRAALLASPNGDTMAMQNTGIAGGPGQPGIISGIPQFTFEFNLPGEIPAGSYQVGVVCTKAGGQTLDTYYVTGMTITADAAAGPAQVNWAEAALGGGTTTTTAGGSTTTTAGGSTTTTADGGTTTTTTAGGSTTTTAGGSTTTSGAQVSGGGVFGGTPSAASPVSTAGQLPFTGSSPIPMVAWAVALLVFGRMAMLMGKRPKVIGDGPAE